MALSRSVLKRFNQIHGWRAVWFAPRTNRALTGSFSFTTRLPTVTEPSIGVGCLVRAVYEVLHDLPQLPWGPRPPSVRVWQGLATPSCVVKTKLENKTKTAQT